MGSLWINSRRSEFLSECVRFVAASASRCAGGRCSRAVPGEARRGVGAMVAGCRDRRSPGVVIGPDRAARAHRHHVSWRPAVSRSSRPARGGGRGHPGSSAEAASASRGGANPGRTRSGKVTLATRSTLSIRMITRRAFHSATLRQLPVRISLRSYRIACSAVHGQFFSGEVDRFGMIVRCACDLGRRSGDAE